MAGPRSKLPPWGSTARAWRYPPARHTSTSQMWHYPSMHQTPRTERLTMPYTFTTAHIWPVRDSAGIVHRVCGVWEPSPLARTRTVCERVDWTPVEPIFVVAEGSPMVTCLECLGVYSG